MQKFLTWIGSDKVFFGGFIMVALLGLINDALEELAEGRYFWAFVAASLAVMAAFSYWLNWRHKIK